jgi:hypothetical protein
MPNCIKDGWGGRCPNCDGKSCKPGAVIFDDGRGFSIPPTETIAAAPALAHQEGGNHYKGLAIQPVEYIHKNGIGFCEGSAIKYLTRWRAKGGIEDLKKARHFIDLLIEMEAQKP